MKIFLKNGVVFSVLLLTILSLLGLAVDAGLKKSRLENFSEWNDIYNSSINAELLITGSSRAWSNISPLILDSAFKINSYNLGMDGYFFEMQYWRYQVYLQHNQQPKYIVQCLDEHTFSNRSDLYLPGQFSPYLDDSLIMEATRPHQGFHPIDYYNPFSKYLYQGRYVIVGLLEFLNLKHFKSKKYKGYEGKKREWDHTFERVKKKSPKGWSVKIDEKIASEFEEYIRDLQKNEIKLILVYPPEYIEGQELIQNRSEIIGLYVRLSRKHNIPFLNYSSDSLSKNKQFFYNSQHLNFRGSQIFSKKLATDIDKFIAVKKSSIDL